MPNLGMSELFVILLIGLLVVGPKRLPEIARNLGKAWRTFQDESRKATEALKGSLEEETAMLKETQQTLRQATDIGVIDRPDAPGVTAPKPRPPNGAADPVSPRAIAEAAEVQIDPDRTFEDT